MLAAIAFTTIEVWTTRGLVTLYLLFLMELRARRVYLAGCTPNPHEAGMKQIARELTSFDDGFLNGKRYLVMDRDEKFTAAFREILVSSGVKYHQERNHQGLASAIIDPGDRVGRIDGTIDCREGVGGICKYYHCQAVQPATCTVLVDCA